MSSKKTVIMVLLFSICFPESRKLLGEHYLTKKPGNIETYWKMDISSYAGKTKVIIEDDVFKKEVLLDNERIQEIEIYENNRLIRSVMYDYAENYVVVKQLNLKSTRERKYVLKDNLWENESLIYLIGRLKLEPGEKYVFQHLNSEKLRLAEMYVENTGYEDIFVNGKSLRAVKYEMGLNGFLMSKIWPHKYYWWYEEKTGRFLRYEGMGENGKDIDKSVITEDEI